MGNRWKSEVKRYEVRFIYKCEYCGDTHCADFIRHLDASDVDAAASRAIADRESSVPVETHPCGFGGVLGRLRIVGCTISVADSVEETVEDE